jgi:hypothetical protein
LESITEVGKSESEKRSVKIGFCQPKIEKLKPEKQKRENGICQRKLEKQKLDFFCADFLIRKENI